MPSSGGLWDAVSSPLLQRQVRLLAPRRAFVAVGLALYALTLPVIGVALATGLWPILTTLFHLILFGTMSLSWGFRALRGAEETAGELVVDEDALRFGGTVLARRSELAQGFLIPDEKGVLVRLERKGPLSPGIHLRVANEAEGRELLRLLGFDASRTAAEMRIATGMLALPVMRQMLLIFAPFPPMLVAAFLLALLHVPAAGPIIGLTVMLTLAWVFGLAFTPTHVRVGTDGIVTRWLGRERYIAYTTVAEIETYDEWVGTKQQRGVKLTLQTGEVVKLPTGQTTIGSSEAARLAERITEARAAGGAGAVAAATLVRGGRSTRAWLSALRATGEGAQDLRTPAVPRDVLLRVVEDATATEGARVGAAIAALGTKDDDAKMRVRIAASATASPKLRIALDRIAAEATEEDLAGILEDIEPEARRIAR
jgi:hypothetical protein